MSSDESPSTPAETTPGPPAPGETPTAPRERARLVGGDVSHHLLQQALPYMVGIMSIIGFTVADTWFVSQLGTAPLAALGFAFPVILIFANLAAGMGVGTASVLSRLIGASSQTGEGAESSIQRTCTHSLLLAFGLGLGLAFVGIRFQDALFAALGAPPDVRILIRQYMEVWFLGLPIFMALIVGNGALRASGDMRLPSILMMSSALVNVVLDPILIFGWWGAPAMGLKGAALATLIARALGVGVGIGLLHFRERMITFAVPSPRRLLQSWYEILHVGIPSAISDALEPFTLTLLTGLVAGFGQEAVAAFGVGNRLEALSYVVLLGISASLGPLSGQNWGAGQVDRVRAACVLAFRWSIGWGVLVFGFFWFFGDDLARAFDDDPAVYTRTHLQLTVISLTYGFDGIRMMASSMFIATGRPYPATSLAAIRLVGVALPFAWFLRTPLGLTGVFVAVALANVVAGLIALYLVLSSRTHSLR